MAKILMLVSSAKVIRLADGTPHPTGYFVEEAIKPYDRFMAAGAEVVVATSDGQTPHPDPYGLEHYFHYPDEDEDFLASVMRTFMQDVDDIRIALQHLSELDLIIARDQCAGHELSDKLPFSVEAPSDKASTYESTRGRSAHCRFGHVQIARERIVATPQHRVHQEVMDVHERVEGREVRCGTEPGAGHLARHQALVEQTGQTVKEQPAESDRGQGQHR